MASRKSSAQSAGNLSAEDWLTIGNRILADDGIAALKIDRLCERAGVTRGSFYWHFTTIGSFREALAQSWTKALAAEREHLDGLATIEPRERLARMMEWLMSESKWTLERAMREWARTDETLAVAVRDADLRVRGAVTTAFIDHGFDADAASLRADLMFSAGIGSMHLGGPGRMRSEQRQEDLLDLLLGGR